MEKHRTPIEDILTTLSAVDEFDKQSDDTLDRAAKIMCLSGIFWLLALSVFFTSADKTLILIFLFFAVVSMVVAATMNAKDAIHFTKNLIPEQIIAITRIHQFEGQVISELSKYSIESLLETKAVLERRTKVITERVTWAFGPVQKSGFVPAVVIVLVGIYEFYQTNSSASITLILSGPVLVFIWVLSVYKKLNGWFGWCDHILVKAIDLEEGKSRPKPKPQSA